MTIEFEKAATCTHSAPAFGCKGCIDKDREGAIRAFFNQAKRPVCPDHLRPMMIASGDRVAMTITYECAEPCGASGDCDEIAVVPVGRADE